MLTDLYAITNSLLRNGVQIKEEANHIKKVAKTNGFLFSFDMKSIISDVEHVCSADISKLWRIVESNQKRFPITNLKSPLCVIDPTDQFSFAEELTVALKENTLPDFLRYCFNKYNIQFNLHKENVKAISVFSYEYPQHIMKQTESKIDGTAFHALLSNMTKWFADGGKTEHLIMYMGSMLCQSVLTGSTDNQADASAVLFGRWNKKKAQFEEPKVQFGFYPTSRKNELFVDSYDRVNKAFLTVSTSKMVGTCALSGKSDQPLITGRFPDVNLPVIGATKMFAMFKGVPAQFRYGKTGAELFPVSEIEANKVVNTLKTICAPEQRSRTWCTIPRPNTIKGEQDLLISWIDGAIDNKISDVIKSALPQLCMIPAAKDSFSEALSSYEAITKNVIDAITKVNSKTIINTKQRIVILSEIDSGNREVVGNFTYDLEKMLLGVKHWSQSCKNDINFRLPIFDAKSGKLSIMTPYVPSPINIAILSKNRYTIAAKTQFGIEFKAHPTIGIPISEIFDIFLKPPTSDVRLEGRLLTHIYKNVVNLLVSFKCDQAISYNYYVDGDRGNSNKALKKYKTQERLDILCSLSFFEIILNRLQDNKRGNMSEESMKVGKLLAKADELQLQYSSIVRGVKHPTRLLGATLFKIASDNPIKALAKLADGIGLYQQWAVSYSNEKSCHAGMLLTQIKKIMTDLNVRKLEGKMSAVDKVELLRGYMSFEKSKKKDNEITSKEKGTENV